jgi:PIN domain nuclease of toxin-antitoxin system
VNIIIDTHIFLWLVYEPQKIPPHSMGYLHDTNNTIYLSAISISEMMIKKSLGNLEITFDILEMCDQMGIDILDFDGASAMLLGTLPFHHKDPFDRMIISQSMSNHYKLLSVDGKFALYECDLLDIS